MNVLMLAGFALAAAMATAIAAAPLAPVPVERVTPYLPEQAYLKGVDGRAAVRAEVNSAGQVDEVQILSEEPAGFGFGAAAADALRQWTFEKDRPGFYEVNMRILHDPNDIPALLPPKDGKLTYPRKAVNAKKQGYADLAVGIGDGGRVTMVDLIEEAPEGWGFAKSATEAVKSWVFPRTAPGLYRIRIKFVLG